MSRISTFLRLFALATTVLFLAGPLLADKPNKKGASDTSFSATITAGISFGEVRKLAVDNGLTGYKPLPPGIRKNLARGKPMPPGIAKTRMPGSFVNQLPHHDGYEWQQAGSDLVLVAIGTMIIADVLEKVFD